MDGISNRRFPFFFFLFVLKVTYYLLFTRYSKKKPNDLGSDASAARARACVCVYVCVCVCVIGRAM